MNTEKYIVIGRVCNFNAQVMHFDALDFEDAKKQAKQHIKSIHDIYCFDDDEISIDYVIDSNLVCRSY